MHGRVRRLLIGLTIAWVVALIGLCLVLAANAVTQSIAPAPLGFQIRKAFQSGVLPSRTTQDLDRERGALVYNDCLILGMALNRDPALPVRIVSPALLESPYDETINKDPCAILYDVTVNRNGALYRGKAYHRYVSAFVPVTAAFVSEYGVATVKHVLLISNYAALAILLAAGLASCAVAARNRQSLPFYRLVLPLAIVLFSGVEFFAQNLSIGMADLGLYGLIAVLLYARPEQWPRAALAIIAASFGVFIAAFEFFTGQIPVMLALPTALLAMKATDNAGLRRVVKTGVLFTLFAAMGAGFLFVQKIALALLVDGPDALSAFINQLALRIGDLSYGVGTMIVYMAGRADRIGQGQIGLGLAYALLSTLAGAVGLAALARRGGFVFHRALVVAASMMLIVLWHIIFRNHSTIHSEFMVRSTSFVFTSGWIIAGFALSAWWSERGANADWRAAASMGGPSNPR